MEKVKISKVIPNENNPRFIKDYKFKKLVRSIKEFPEMLKLRPIVVNKDMVVLGGNMRLKACAEAGLKEVYILKADNLTEKQQKEFIVKDNVGFGEWDWDTLANEWDTDQLKEWGMDIPKWEDKDGFDGKIDETGDYDFPEDDLETSHVKMVQLFLNTKTEPLFKKWELQLREIYKTDNLTDTIFKVLEDSHKLNYGSKNN
tara:strand:- start:5033 stop:5635 length:603 start_codon:yes stop_codon:yes gene_type:complete